MVTLVPVSGLDESQRDLFEAWVEVYAASGREVFGDEHTAWGADELRVLEAKEDRRTLGVAAVDPGGVVVGAAAVVLRLRDNPRAAFISLAVRPEHRRQGTGSRLLAWVEEQAQQAGRSVFIVETEWPDGCTDSHGEGFAARHGYQPVQHTLRSTLHLPLDRATLAHLVGANDVRKPDVSRPDDPYVLETSLDGIPDSWLEDRAELQRRMSTDAPLGDLQLEEEDWDAERVRDQYATVLAMGRRVVETVARHVPTGRLVGYTQVQVSPETPTLAYQQDTLVVREHRGHALGLRLKAANTAAVMEHLPEVTAVRTWNADDNTHMLAVNRRLGYVVDAHLGEWQKVLGLMGGPATATAVVTAIHIAPGSRLPTKSVESVEAEEGKGLVGDRYHGTRHRHVTVQVQSDLDAAAVALGAPVPAGSTRRNLTVSHGPLPTKPGARLRIGDVELEVVRIAAPCRLLDDWIAPGAMKAMHGRGGTVFRLLSSGTIRVGDRVEADDAAGKAPAG